MMNKTYHIKLHDFDLGQVLDGLEVRTKAWQNAAEYHRTGRSSPNFSVEECCDAEEAEKIAGHYRSIIAKIRTQRAQQDTVDENK